jgi:cell division transport system ATP-binding protein
VIRLEHVTRHYGAQVALEDVNLEVREGELVVITGPSGSGKSTLLRMLYAAERPDSGRIEIAHRDVTRLRRASVPLLRRNVGVVFQDFKLLAGRSALENVMLPLEILGLPRRIVRERALMALSDLGVATRADTRAGSLSGGEQQRVALARALVSRPALLLCDEPTGNLDPESARGVLAEIARAHERGSTTILATHDPMAIQLAAERGFRRVQLRAGRVESDGLSRPALVTPLRSRSVDS